jgi:transcriptional repressor NrdR
VQCPFCGSTDSSVTETRDSPEGLRRRRTCAQCKRRFTTYERALEPGLKVAKRDGSTEAFDGHKLHAALARVCARRPVDDETLRELVRTVSARLVDSGRKTVRWSEIVEETLRVLEPIDAVSAQRLAGDYRDEDGALRLREDDAGEEATPPQLGLFRNED